MGGSLATLIRLRSWDCEQGRRHVFATKARMDALSARLADLLAGRDRERAAAETLPPEARFGFAAYEQRVRAEARKLGAELEAAAGTLAEARARLAHAYREKRKLELAEESRLRTEAAARGRRECLALDEIALRAAKSPPSG